VPQAGSSRSAHSARLAAAVAVTLAVAACASEPEPNPSNVAPSATIALPATGATFRGGDSVAYAGSATDPEDGTVPASRLTWWVELHHDTHTHPFMPKTQGAGGKAFVPTTGETSDNIFLRFYLEAVDASGAADTVSRDVLPEKAQLTLATGPAGLSVTLDGQPQVTPVTITGVVGMERELGATTPQTVGSTQYQFSSWSDGGAVTHRIATPAVATTYTAQFSVVANQVPTVSLTAPASGSSVTINTTPTLTATATDADGTVVKVGFYDGGTLLGEDTTSPYSWNWTPTVTGTHLLTARATDNQGAVATSTTVSVTVNPSGGGLSVMLTSPAAQTTGITGSPTFTVTTSGSVAAVEYQVDGETVGQGTSSPWSFTLPATAAYTTGVHVIRARARDAAGNVSAWSSARVTFGGNENLPDGFSRSTLVQGLGDATAMAFSPDGRLFICEQGGALRVVKNGALLATPFVMVPTTADGERGLLGVAFHPQFATNGWVYVYYTSAVGGAHNRISRFTASGDVAQAGETVISDLPALSATNHNGGAIHFGPDGKLYVAVGENANPSNAQSLNTRLGKILRYNDDGTIPADNPLLGSTTGVNQAIWALGLRNPFSFAFEPGSNRMFINDVGQSTWEEINLGRATANYGWPATEGATTNPAYDSPLYAYGHSSNSSLVTGIAIVGGAFYRPTTTMFPASWLGHYFFGDYGGGFVNRLDPVNGNAAYAFARLGLMTDLQVGTDGALYVLGDVAGGWGVYRYSRP